MTTPDYATWLTKQQAADAIGVTTKSVERFVQAGAIQQARWQRDGRGPLLAVYHPDDVARIAQERQRGPLPAFVVPGSTRSPNGNGHGDVQALARVPAEGGSGSLVRGDDLLLALSRLLCAVSETSQTSQTLFLTIPEAAAVSGFSQAYLRRKCQFGWSGAIKDGAWKIRRKDLEAL